MKEESLRQGTINIPPKLSTFSPLSQNTITRYYCAFSWYFSVLTLPKKQKQQQQQETGTLACLNDKAITGDPRPLLLLLIEG